MLALIIEPGQTTLTVRYAGQLRKNSFTKHRSNVCRVWSPCWAQSLSSEPQPVSLLRALPTNTWPPSTGHEKGHASDKLWSHHSVFWFVSVSCNTKDKVLTVSKYLEVSFPSDYGTHPHEPVLGMKYRMFVHVISWLHEILKITGYAAIPLQPINRKWQHVLEWFRYTPCANSV